MSNNPRWLMVLSYIALALSAVWIGFTALSIPGPDNTNLSAPRQGFSAPHFELITLQGNTITLNQFSDQMIIINFWASWCPPCRSEMPAFQAVSEYYGDEDVIVLAINATYQDDITSVNNFLEEHAITLTIPLDNQGLVSRSYKVSALPTTFIIDRSGIIQKVVFGGPVSKALLFSQIDRILEED